MAREKKRLPRGPGVYLGSSGEWSLDKKNLLDQAPRFSALAKAAEKGTPELSSSQKEFLDKFADRLVTGVTEGADTSVPDVVSKPARPGLRTRPKGRQ